MGINISSLHNTIIVMQNRNNMYTLIKKEMNDDGQERVFTLFQTSDKEEIRRAWEGTLDKVGLEIIED